MEIISLFTKSYALLLMIAISLVFWHKAVGHHHVPGTRMTLGQELLFSLRDSKIGDVTAGIPAELFIWNNMDKVSLQSHRTPHGLCRRRGRRGGVRWRLSSKSFPVQNTVMFRCFYSTWSAQSMDDAIFVCLNGVVLSDF